MNTDHRYLGLFVFVRGKKLSLLYRLKTGALGIAESADGMNFTATGKAVSFVSKSGTKQSTESFSSFRVGYLGGDLILTFLRDNDGSLGFASSEKGLRWKVSRSTSGFTHPTVLAELPLAPKSEKRQVVAFSGSGRKFITLAVSDRAFKRWDDRGVVLEGRPRHFDASSIVPMYAAATKQGLLLIYTAKNQQGLLTVGAALFDPERPETVLWRSGSPLWTAPSDWYGKNVSILGGAPIGKYFYGYFQRERGEVEMFPMSRLWEAHPIPKRSVAKKISVPKKPERFIAAIPHRLARHHENPILAPRPEHPWEALSAFNAAAVCLDDRVHLLYRAQGHDGISVLGYAGSDDGSTITERAPDPVFVPSNPFDHRKKDTPPFSYPYLSGGGWGGCEDPRIARVGRDLYMTYVAFNGIHPPGVALARIRVADFLKHRWEAWSAPKLISRPGTMQKNWVIFPEKIRGKYAILHNISPDIRIEYLDSLDGDILIDSLPPRPGPRDAERWDNIVRGVGAPPIRTEAGWIVFYHAMDARDPNRYKIGAMLLDLRHPETVLARASDPVLEPETDYENHGHKHGVVYVCGAIVKDGTIFVYYGASDRTLAVATAPLDRFVSALRTAKTPRLESITLS